MLEYEQCLSLMPFEHKIAFAIWGFYVILSFPIIITQYHTIKKYQYAIDLLKEKGEKK